MYSPKKKNNDAEMKKGRREEEEREKRTGRFWGVEGKGLYQARRSRRPIREKRRAHDTERAAHTMERRRLSLSLSLCSASLAKGGGPYSKQDQQIIRTGIQERASLSPIHHPSLDLGPGGFPSTGVELAWEAKGGGKGRERAGCQSSSGRKMGLDGFLPEQGGSDKLRLGPVDGSWYKV